MLSTRLACRAPATAESHAARRRLPGLLLLAKLVQLDLLDQRRDQRGTFASEWH